eukprot:2060295-Alexandrium_andersonii.AAC.1
MPGLLNGDRQRRTTAICAVGWRRKSLDRFPTAMATRSQEGQDLRFSAYHYPPKWLVYRDDAWRDVPLEAVGRTVGQARADSGATRVAIDGW